MNTKLTIAGLAVAAASLIPHFAEARSFNRQCEDFAYRSSYVNGNGDRVVQGAVGGAVAGAAIGAIVGGGNGNSIGQGALVGGVAGTAIGIASNGQRYDRREFDRSYASCMNDRANYAYDNSSGPAVNGDGYRLRHNRNRMSSRVSFCISNHPSYNPQTGMYRTNSGAFHVCR